MRPSFLLSALVAPSLALRNGLDLVPPMGWSNWESSGCNINETYMRASADALVAKGLAAAGYTIVEVDDCWAELARNATGYLVANASRFPSGMGALGEYLHGAGLKFGMYSSAGVHCCQHTMPGSLGYEWLDAQAFASWGVDFLKYDGCFMEEFAAVEQDAARRFPFAPPPILRYPLMAQALNRTGRSISYMCNFPWQFWGLEKDAAMGGRWVSESCNSWRTAGDPQPGFRQALGYIGSTEKYADDVPSGPGAWATLDAMEIGNTGSFDHLPENEAAWSSSGGGGGGGGGALEKLPLSAWREGAAGGMSAAQERAVFSLYAIVKTPLFIGADVTALSGHSLQAYLNADAIAVHQDGLGAPGRRLAQQGDTQVWGCALSGGRAAAVLLNGGGVAAPSIAVSWAQLGLAAGATCTVYDVWKHAEVGSFAGSFEAKGVDATSAIMVVVHNCTA